MAGFYIISALTSFLSTSLVSAAINGRADGRGGGITPDWSSPELWDAVLIIFILMPLAVLASTCWSPKITYYEHVAPDMNTGG